MSICGGGVVVVCSLSHSLLTFIIYLYTYQILYVRVSKWRELKNQKSYTMLVTNTEFKIILLCLIGTIGFLASILPITLSLSGSLFSIGNMMSAGVLLAAGLVRVVVFRSRDFFFQNLSLSIKNLSLSL